MALFDLHIDRELAALGGGALSPRRFRAVVQHARNCHRCATQYERAVRVLRQLEHQSPFVPAQVELDAITALNAPRGRAPGAANSAWALGLLGAVAATALAVVLLRPTAGDEFTARGGAGQSLVALRVFCGGNGAALSELREGAACTAGQSLAFALGAQPTHARVAVAVSGSAAAPGSVSAQLAARPGAEEPVALTVKLERAGEVEVVAAFAADAASADLAARGERVSGALVLRRTVKVAP